MGKGIVNLREGLLESVSYAYIWLECTFFQRSDL